MDDMQTFYLLKQKIRDKYADAYPYYTGSLHNFGNKEIAQLIDLVEKVTRERVSEKWVYTHLKPVENTKLPRKDMLDIWCRWLDYTGWDAFVFTNKTQTATQNELTTKTARQPKKRILYMTIGLFIAATCALIGFTVNGGSHNKTICLKDKYTQKSIEANKLTLHLLKEGKKEKLPHNKDCFILATDDSEALVLVESPYYKADTLRIDTGNGDSTLEFDLQPDDYAMMVRAYMNGNMADWNKRRKQLSEIISDDAVIQEIMFNEIGVEFLNKDEFIDKITTPSKIVKTMEIVEIEYEKGKIISLKYMKKGQ